MGRAILVGGSTNPSCHHNFSRKVGVLLSNYSGGFFFVQGRDRDYSDPQRRTEERRGGIIIVKLRANLMCLKRSGGLRKLEREEGGYVDEAAFAQIIYRC